MQDWVSVQLPFVAAGQKKGGKRLHVTQGQYLRCEEQNTEGNGPSGQGKPSLIMSSVPPNDSEETDMNKSIDVNQAGNETEIPVDHEDTKISFDESPEDMDSEDKIADDEETTDKHVIFSPTKRIRTSLEPM
jgi:hypothetical protein